MTETKKALSTGQAESAEGCAKAQNDGERKNPTETLYNADGALSTQNEKKIRRVFVLGMGFKEKVCAACGKIFIPTCPEYAWGNYCSYTCFIHRNEGTGRLRMFSLSGEYLKTFDTIEEARDFCGLKSERSILEFFKGRTRSAGGFLWAWDNTKKEG